MRIIILLITASIIFIKCYTPSYDFEIKSLDTLSKSLASSEENLIKIDTNKIDNEFTILTNNFNKLEKRKGEKLNNNIITIDEDYKSLKVSYYDNYKIQLKNLIIETEHNKQLISELKNKLVGGYIPKPTYESYFGNYKINSQNLNKNISIFTVNTNNNIEKTEKLNMKINSLVK